MKTIKIKVLGLVFCACSASVFAGSGLGLGMSAGKSRVCYLGIGIDTLIKSEDEFSISPFACSDAQRVESHIKLRATGRDSFFSSRTCHQFKKDHLRRSFAQINTRSRKEDIFVFYFGGFTERIKTQNGEVTAFFMTAPDMDILGKGEYSRLDSNTYFTLAELRIWMNAVPARNQLVLIEAGFTNELKNEFSQMLLESNAEIGQLENRNRVLLFPQGMGIEDMELKGGRFTYAMTTGLEKNNYNLLDVFVKDKQETFEYQCWRSYVQVNEKSGIYVKGFNLIKEWELQKFMVSPKSKTRGETIVVRTPTHKVVDTLPHFYAFVCGTNKYDFLDPLSNARQDADSIAGLLQRNFGFHTKVVHDLPDVNVFMDQLAHFTDSIHFGPQDELFVFIAGHGTYDARSDAGFIAFGNSKLESSMRSYLEHRRLVNILDNLQVKKVMLVLDVCYGGSLSQGLASQSDPRLCNAGGICPSGIWPYKGPSARMVFQNLNCANRVYLTSGGFDTVEDGVAGAHSPFARGLISVLSQNQEGILFSSDVFSGVKRDMSVKQGITNQTPTYGRFGLDNNSTDFVFIRKN